VALADKVKVLVVGLGNMGASHASAYHRLDGFEIVGIMSRTIKSNTKIPAELAGYPLYEDFAQALKETRPDAVSINSWPNTHAEYALKAIAAGCHVFMEKPLATNIEDAEKVVAAARAKNRKLVLGYILRVHPSWIKFIEVGKTLGKPLVMRLNLNQQSSGSAWHWHKNLIDSLIPIVDCGVHYVDVMCQITDAAAVEVRGMGLRLSDEIAPEMYNYGHFQVLFGDGSLGWYEAGWGPMMSDTAFFVKDVVSPNGAVSIRMPEGARSDDIETHTRTSTIRLHRVGRPDEDLSMADEPGHQALCDRQAAFVARAVAQDLDLSRHLQDAVASLRICLAADESVRSGLTVKL
jgi:predicted dehydrogenase